MIDIIVQGGKDEEHRHYYNLLITRLTESTKPLKAVGWFKHQGRHYKYSPPTVVTPCGDGWALRAGIGMPINLPGYPMSVTQCYLTMNNTHYSVCLLICIISK